MSSLKFDIRDDGDLARAKAHLRRIRERAQSLEPAFEAVLDWFADANEEMFATRGARFGIRWRRLKPETIERKRAQGYPTDPLIRTTAMSDTLTGRPFGFERIEARGAIAGTTVPRAVWHQRGVKKNNLPARRMIHARAVAREGVVGNAVLSWVVHGVPDTRGVIT